MYILWVLTCLLTCIHHCSIKQNSLTTLKTLCVLPIHSSYIFGNNSSMGSLGVGHDWTTSLSCIGEGNGNPLQCSCLENPRDGGAWGAAVYGVAQSWTWLKRLSSSSSMDECFPSGVWKVPFLSDHTLQFSAKVHTHPRTAPKVFPGISWKWS